MTTSMDLESEILREHSKQNMVRIARWVGTDSARFKQLMELFLHGDYRTTQLAAWVVSYYCVEWHPQLARPWLKPMLKRMQEPGVHDAVKRSVLRILQFVDIPRSLQGSVATVCFGYLQSPDTPIAVRVFSMTVLARIAEQQPDLRNELKLVIQQMLPYGGAAIRARARNVLKKLG